MSVLGRDFYARDTLEVARSLLGCKLRRKNGGEIFSGIIVETEAYTGDDPACHAYRGCTPRSSTLFKQPGIAYVYLVYGMYYCLNFVTEKQGAAGAVLIRAVEAKNANGPGKLCRELEIDKTLNEADVTDKKSGLWVEKELSLTPGDIVTTTRIGIKKAADYPWRFYIRGNAFVSRA